MHGMRISKKNIVFRFRQTTKDKVQTIQIAYSSLIKKISVGK